MSEMRFEDNQNEFGRPPTASGGLDVSGLLVKWGIASSRQQAEYILLVIGAVCLILAGYLFFFSGGSTQDVGPRYADPTAPVVLVQ